MISYHKTLFRLFAALCVAILFVALQVQAQIPFGGRVTTVKTPATIQCGTRIDSPFSISPVKGLAGPWSAMTGLNVGTIKPGSWILGLTMSGVGSCVIPGTPPVPYPTSVTNFYGTSSLF